jgi:hypothetical protein
MAREQNRKNTKKPLRRGNVFSKKTQPFFIGDLVDLNHTHHHHSLRDKMGVVLDVENKEGEWFLKIQFQDGTEVITYFAYVRLLVGIDD